MYQPVTIETLTARKPVKKKKKFDFRKDERGFPIADCRDGLTPPWDNHSEEARTARLAALDAEIEQQDQRTKRRVEQFGRKQETEYCCSRHIVTCGFCDVPVDVLQERLDRRFPISPEEREAERKRIEGFFTHYQIQTTKEL
jgi:hypothetical protein